MPRKSDAVEFMPILTDRRVLASFCCRCAAFVILIAAQGLTSVATAQPNGSPGASTPIIAPLNSPSGIPGASHVLTSAAGSTASPGPTVPPTGTAGDSFSARDPFARPNSPVNGNSGSPQVEAVKLSVQASFTNVSPRVNDSLDYILQVEWQETEVPVFVLAPDSVNFSGFKILGQAAQHKKLASDQGVRNHTDFIYRLRAQTQGSGRASLLKLRYLTGLSKQEEAVFVQPALVDIAAAPVNILEQLWFKLLAGLLLMGGAAALATVAFKWSVRRRLSRAPVKLDLRPEVSALGGRLRMAANNPDASKEILLEMERLGLKYLLQELESGGAKQTAKTGKAPADVAKVLRFDEALDQYLVSYGNLEGTQGISVEAQDWNRLRELFRHARFAGGYKEPHELQDAFKIFKRCIKMTGVDENE